MADPEDGELIRLIRMSLTTEEHPLIIDTVHYEQYGLGGVENVIAHKGAPMVVGHFQMAPPNGRA